MTAEVIKCPGCGKEIELSKAITSQLEEKLSKGYQKQIDEAVKSSEEKLKLAKSEMETKYEQKLRIELDRAMTSAKQNLAEENRQEISDLKNQLEEKAKKLSETQKIEIELRKERRELAEKQAALDLELARKLDDERLKLREAVAREAEEKHRLKEAEREKQIADMTEQIDQLKRKAEQGSEQRQGEVLELELEELLKNEFPFDDVEPVAKGVKGADVLHTVKRQSGHVCGKILWETKRTKAWSDSWIQKLKDDQREAKADIAVLVSETLPKGFRNFRQISGIWVADIPSSMSLALALRVVLNQESKARELQVGKNEKMEVVYTYLTGAEFRSRVEAVLEAFVAMKQDLEGEKRNTIKRWAAREKQIEKVIHNIAGMHGDLEGIVGSSLPAVKMLELSSEESKEDETVLKEVDVHLQA